MAKCIGKLHDWLRAEAEAAHKESMKLYDKLNHTTNPDAQTLYASLSIEYSQKENVLEEVRQKLLEICNEN